MAAEPLTITSGDLSARFLPSLGCIGVSLRHRGAELLALPRSLADYRTGGPTGMPLLHPFANRLVADRFDAYGARIDARAAPRDGHGLPIHGTAHASQFTVELADATRVRASLDWTGRADLMAGFPFPHTVIIDASVARATLRVTTDVHNTGSRPMPVSFGWHPFFTVPHRPRAAWVLRLPARGRHLLDGRLLPTGSFVEQAAERAPIGARTYDDHFDLGDDRCFEIGAGGRTLRMTLGAGYPHAQVYLPHASWPVTGDFVCIEPMVATVNALAAGTAPTVAPGATFAATFTVEVIAAA